MIINTANLSALFTNIKTSFNTAFEAVESHYERVAMVTSSATREETYAWLEKLPRLREWVGDRVIKNLSAQGYAIKNRKFEDTIGVPRDDIEDDKYGVYGPLFSEMGRAAAEHPDQLIFELIPSGFTTPCYDGQFFFDTDHPVTDENGVVQSVSNMQAGAQTPWYLLDTTRMIRPFIFQKRVPYAITSLTRDEDENVFMRDEFLFGVRARVNAGFGLWQLAFGSKADLTSDNYRDARIAMMSMKGEEGRLLGIRPKTLLVGPSNEEKALEILNSGSRAFTVAAGDSVALNNPWAGTADLIVTPWLP